MSTAGKVPDELKPKRPKLVMNMKVRFLFATLLAPAHDVGTLRMDSQVETSNKTATNVADIATHADCSYTHISIVI